MWLNLSQYCLNFDTRVSSYTMIEIISSPARLLIALVTVGGFALCAADYHTIREVSDTRAVGGGAKMDPPLSLSMWR